MYINKQWFIKLNIRWREVLASTLLTLLAASSTLATPFPNVPLLAGTENCDIGPVRSSSDLALSSRRYKAGVLAFNASYQPGTWTGDLVATEITTGAVRWQLSKTFNNVNADFKDRPIFRGGQMSVWAMNGFGGWSSLAARPHATTKFTIENRNTSPSHDYRITPPDVIMDEDTFHYLRGDQSKEDGVDFRIRSHPIGDIVHSGLAYRAGETSGSQGYLYVGANDGMLHGIDADNGKVLFSYIPRGVTVDNLVTLKDPDYKHRFFVDGHIRAIPEANGPRVLGTLGRGGRGIFALDVSDPENINVIIDSTLPATDTDSEPDIGYLLGPVYYQVYLMSPRTRGSPEELEYHDPRVIYIIPNGINSPNNEAKLLMSLPESSMAGPHPNQLSKLIAFPSDGSKDNGLLVLAMMKEEHSNLKGAAYQALRIYGGDLKGNIWVWSYRKENPNKVGNYRSAKVFEGDPSRPVTGITLARNAEGQVVVGFGTGSYAFEDDRNSSQPQRLYSVIDDYQTTVKPTDLTRRSLNGPGAVPILEPYAELPASSRGWYIDLVAPEQVTHAPVVIGSAMYVNLVSPPATAGLGCTAVGPGSTRTVAVNIFTGTSAEPEWPYFPATQTDGITSEGVATTLRVLSDDEENGKTYLMTNLGHLELPKPVETLNMESRLFQSGRLQWREILR